MMCDVGILYAMVVHTTKCVRSEGEVPAFLMTYCTLCVEKDDSLPIPKL